LRGGEWEVEVVEDGGEGVGEDEDEEEVVMEDGEEDDDDEPNGHPNCPNR
jgi:hypothetical protein